MKLPLPSSIVVVLSGQNRGTFFRCRAASRSISQRGDHSLSPSLSVSVSGYEDGTVLGTGTGHVSSSRELKVRAPGAFSL